MTPQPHNYTRPHGIVVETWPEEVCFLAIPFSPHFRAVSLAIESAARQAGLDPIRTDKRNHGPSFIDAIAKKSRAARAVVADCSPDPESGGLPNPNVLYELGLATAVGKPTLVLTSDASTLPSDLRDRTYETYGPDEIEKDHFVHKLELWFRSTKDRCGAHGLIDPEYSAIRVISPHDLLSLDKSDRILDILQFGKIAHHEFQSFDAAFLDRVRREIERIGGKETVQAERRDFTRAWRQAESFFRNQLEQNILATFEERCRDVERWFGDLTATVQSDERKLLEWCVSCFGNLKRRITEYPQWMHNVESHARRLPDILLDEGASNGLCDDIVRLSDETKFTVVETDNLILNLIDLLLKRRAQ